MKKIRFLYILLAGIFIIPSCTDDEKLNQNFPLNGLTNGAFVRTLLPVISNSANFFDLENAKYEVNIEVNDGGVQFTDLEVFVRYVDNLTEEGENSTNEALLRTYVPGDFTTNPDSGLPRRNLTVTVPEMIDALSLDMEDLEGGNSFTIRLVLNLSDGRSFTNTNTGVDLRAVGGAFASPFFYTLPLVCPSELAAEIDEDDDEKNGTDFEYVNNITASPFGPACSGTQVAGTVNIGAVPGETGVYLVSDASFGLFGCINDSWGNGEVFLLDACGILSFDGSDKYGGTYNLTFVSNNGTDLVFDWINSFGEGGTVTLTGPEADWWPPDLK